MEGTKIEKFKVKVKADTDIAASLGIFNEPPAPFYEHTKFEIVIDSDLSMEKLKDLMRLQINAMRVITLTTTIIPEIVLKKKDK